jgi:cell division protein FtsB
MDTTITKIQKHLDALKARNEKLQAENQKLKSTVADLKSLNSRVRRIPKAQ